MLCRNFWTLWRSQLQPVQRQGMRAGVVSDGNQTVGQGYDSRLQPWERFSQLLSGILCLMVLVVMPAVLLL